MAASEPAVAAPPAVGAACAVPLCVDLDGTLIHTDLLWESLARLLKQKPWEILLTPLWLMRGRAHLKRQLAQRIKLDPATLPYNEPLLAHLRAEKSRGRPLFLVTASDTTLARSVADHLGLFDDVMGSDGEANLRGAQKADALTARFGEKQFDYAGNAAVDLEVWPHAREAVLVNASASLRQQVRARFTVQAEFDRPGGNLRACWILMRPHQWVKNLIVLVPLVTAHQITDSAVLALGLRAVVAFCLCASAIYILNDLLDVDADRHHPTKRCRPLAAGTVPLWSAGVHALLLLIGGSAIALTTSALVTGVLAAYVATSLAYSWRLKQLPLLDVFVLAGLYTLRLIAGHAATGIKYSVWLLVFSMFIFLSLALVKRFHEVKALAASNAKEVRGRGYLASDLQLLLPLGVTSGYLAVLVLALYVSSDQVRELYRQPVLLLLICPLFLYWISRVWLIAHRGAMHDDPVVFALKDLTSYAVVLLALGTIWLAT